MRHKRIRSSTCFTLRHRQDQKHVVPLMVALRLQSRATLLPAYGIHPGKKWAGTGQILASSGSPHRARKAAAQKWADLDQNWAECGQRRGFRNLCSNLASTWAGNGQILTISGRQMGTKWTARPAPGNSSSSWAKVGRKRANSGWNRAACGREVGTAFTLASTTRNLCSWSRRKRVRNGQILARSGRNMGVKWSVKDHMADQQGTSLPRIRKPPTYRESACRGFVCSATQ